MKVAIDARELEGQRTGVGRYLHEILCAWSGDAAARRHEFVLCSSDAVNTDAYRGLNLSVQVASGRGLLWEQLTLPGMLRGLQPDVLLAPGYTAPLSTKVPTVLVVHDVSFASHPEWFSWREGARRRQVTRLAARRAARVVTVSRFSKGEIEAQLGVPASRISVIHNGVTAMSGARAQERHDGAVLFVGSIFNRRHVPLLIDAVALLAGRGLPVSLDIVGDNRTSPPIDLESHVRLAGVADRVRVRSWVSDADLADCYARACVFAFLSEYEGFGLTPLEALAAGVPIVVLDQPVTREIYGGAATFVSGLDVQSVTEALDRALFDAGERERVLAAAADVVASYSWTRSATALLALLIEAV